MHMDGAALFAAAQEMRSLLDNGRLERIAQPAKYDITMVIRSGGKNRRLLLSADPESARAYICAEGRKGPEKPFPFLMLLRKHLLHGRILSIDTPQMDRVLSLRILSSNELGDKLEYILVSELMGKHSNIILVGADGLVIDSVKRVTPSMSSLRTVLPAEAYSPPPSQQKLDVLDSGTEQIAVLFSGSDDIRKPIGDEDNSADIIESPVKKPLKAEKVFVESFYGISPFTARQICRRAGVDEDALTPLPEADAAKLADECAAFFAGLKANEFAPHMVFDNDEAYGFFPYEAVGYTCEPRPTLNGALDEYYGLRRDKTKLEQLRVSLSTSINLRLEKLRKRLMIQQENAVNAKDMERTRTEGELILAYTYMIKRGMESAKLYDHTAEAEVEIKLDPSLTPAENAAKRFKRYNRLKAAAEQSARQLAEIQPDIEYLEGVLLFVEQCDEYDALMQVREELQRQRYISKPQQRTKNAPPRESQPIHLLSTAGTEMLAGRNNAQNDLITTRIARSTDTWLHAQGMPGSHVVIRSKNVTPETLVEAAMVAAYFSRGRRSSNVPIDYTLIKNVHKPSGSKPGFVTYVAQKTLFVTPDEHIVKSLIQES